MNYHKCCIEECQCQADIKCSCMIYLCENHRNAHLGGKTHHFLNLQTIVNAQTQREAINYLQREIEKLRFLKGNLVNEVYKNIMKIESKLEIFCSKIDNDIEEIAKYTKQILEIDQFSHYDENSEFKWLNGNSDEGVSLLEKKFRDRLRADQVDNLVYDIFYKEVLDIEKAKNLIVISGLEEKSLSLETEIVDLRKHYEILQLQFKELTEKYENEKEFTHTHGGPSVRCCLCRRFFYDDQLVIHDCGCVSCKNCKLPENRKIEDFDQNEQKVFCWVCGKFKDNENNWICFEEKLKKAINTS
ncbi:unnamed protein product [Blepharisma stoltei]|uniref:RING-type domain-containing protein n=1 Tax=Blepharisma stoltei TaxID=1481888 RepID=A0AAU9JNA6_9CILI|nr:unnamed protein product [Blepharisma stoltei]